MIDSNNPDQELIITAVAGTILPLVGLNGNVVYEWPDEVAETYRHWRDIDFRLAHEKARERLALLMAQRMAEQGLLPDTLEWGLRYNNFQSELVYISADGEESARQAKEDEDTVIQRWVTPWHEAADQSGR